MYDSKGNIIRRIERLGLNTIQNTLQILKKISDNTDLQKVF